MGVMGVSSVYLRCIYLNSKKIWQIKSGNVKVRRVVGGTFRCLVGLVAWPKPLWQRNGKRKKLFIMARHLQRQRGSRNPHVSQVLMCVHVRCVSAADAAGGCLRGCSIVELSAIRNILWICNFCFSLVWLFWACRSCTLKRTCFVDLHGRHLEEIMALNLKMID